MDNFEEEPQSWLKKLEKNGEYVLIPGEILRKKGKALAFQIDGLNHIWLPPSQIKDINSVKNKRGLWVKDWIVKKKLEDIFEISI